MESQKADGILLLPDNLSQSEHGETGGIGLYLAQPTFSNQTNWSGLATSVEQTLADYTERFGKSVSDFSPLPFLCIKFLYLIRCPAMAAMSLLLHL